MTKATDDIRREDESADIGRKDYDFSGARKNPYAFQAPSLSAGEELGLTLLQSVREMNAGNAARVTAVAHDEVAQARQNSGLSPTEFDVEARGESSE